MKLLPWKQSTLSQRKRPNSQQGRVPAFSYHAYRSHDPGAVDRRIFRDTADAEAISHKASSRLHRFGLLIMSGAVLISLANILAVSPDPKVVLFDNDQAAVYLRPASVYQQAARKLFSRSLADRTKLTIDTTAVSAALKAQFPELAGVTIELPLIGHRPIIYITPTKAVLVLTNTSDQSYVVNENGRVLSRLTSDNPASSSLVRVIDQSGASFTIGQPALASDTVAFIRVSAYQLRQKHMTISVCVLPAGKSELDVHLGGQSYFVKFNLSSPPQQQVGTFLAVQHDLEEQGIRPTSYIDVRVPGRAYYK